VWHFGTVLTVWHFGTVLTVWHFGTVLTVWHFGTVLTVWHFGTVLTVWHFGTVPTVWHFGTVPTVWYVLFFILLQFTTNLYRNLHFHQIRQHTVCIHYKDHWYSSAHCISPSLHFLAEMI
jgi:hypothetical protein